MHCSESLSEKKNVIYVYCNIIRNVSLSISLKACALLTAQVVARNKQFFSDLFEWAIREKKIYWSNIRELLWGTKDCF